MRRKKFSENIFKGSDLMKKLAFIFPGQGAQFVGMGKDLFDKFDVAKKIFAQADEALGYSIQKLCFEGPADELQLTANTQPAILTMSVVASEILKENGIEPSIAGGHSLGEYSALVSAGAIDFQTAVVLVHHRGQYMQEAVPVGEGGMAAIIGLPDETIVDVCAEVSKSNQVQAVNFNCPGQTVIAGTSKGVELAVEKLQAAGAKKAVILPVSAPFHSILMKPAAEKLALELEKIDLKDAKFPVTSNFTGKLESKASEIKSNLISQADNPVHWIDCVNSMKDFGAELFIEAGPGKTLAGFNKRIDRKLETLTVGDLETLQKSLDYLGEVR